MRIAIIALAAFLIMGGIAAALIWLGMERENYSYFSHLDKMGHRTRATVITVDPANHNTIRYEFQADDQRQQGTSNADPPNPDASQLRPGDSVAIVYDPAFPDYSCACDPHADANSAIGAVFGAWAFFGAIAAALAALAVSLLRGLSESKSR